MVIDLDRSHALAGRFCDVLEEDVRSWGELPGDELMAALVEFVLCAQAVCPGLSSGLCDALQAIDVPAVRH